MTTLTDFLLARIAEEMPEGAPAKELGPDDTPYYYSSYRHEGSCSLVGAAWGDPVCDCNGAARVLAECEAKRRIVEAMALPDNLIEATAQRVADIARRVVLGNLAMPYAERPDYREEWKP